jgi:hypothetical protein
MSFSNGVDDFSSSDDSQIVSRPFATGYYRFTSHGFDVDLNSLRSLVSDAGLVTCSSSRHTEVAYVRPSAAPYVFRNSLSFLLLFDMSVRPFVLSFLDGSPTVRSLLDYVGSHSPRLSSGLFGFQFCLDSSRIRLVSLGSSSYDELADDFILFLDGSPSLHQFRFL